MNTLLFQPTDTLFFRDGRPMGGSSSGHGAAWPLPTVINAALHAALWRAGDALADVHFHRAGRSSNRPGDAGRTRKFGSLVTAGPYPVGDSGIWYFSRPADAQGEVCTRVTLKPTSPIGSSTLPKPLRFSVGSTIPPAKSRPEPWWSAAAWQEYLSGGAEKSVLATGSNFLNDEDFSDTEHQIGIEIDPDTGTQDGTNIYSAHSLRLREGWQLGVLAGAMDKIGNDCSNKRDLIASMFPSGGEETSIIVGGQQRICTARRGNPPVLPLPQGATIPGTRVKWVLLAPAIFPGINEHPGGWLPSWVDTQGDVQLLDGPGKNYAGRHKVAAGKRIPAQLVAAIVGKPVPVTGYALPTSADSERTDGGAKPTHLAVPAGSVYYFECDSPEAAQALAVALNWHGASAGAAIQNRRSTLMGEKGFGLGVCGPWAFHPGSVQSV